MRSCSPPSSATTLCGLYSSAGKSGARAKSLGVASPNAKPDENRCKVGCGSASIDVQTATLDEGSTATREHLQQPGVSEIFPVFVLSDDGTGDNQKLTAVFAGDLFEKCRLILRRQIIQAFDRRDDVEAFERHAQKVGGFEPRVRDSAGRSSGNRNVTQVDAGNAAGVGKYRLCQMTFATTKLKNRLARNVFRNDAPQDLIAEASV